MKCIGVSGVLRVSLKGQLSCGCIDVFTLFLFPHRPACVKLCRCPSLRPCSGCADSAEGLQSLKESTDNSTCHLSDGLLTKKRKRRERARIGVKINHALSCHSFVFRLVFIAC